MSLLNKTALTKDGTKMGRITRLYGNNEETIISNREHVVIEVKTFFRKLFIKLQTKSIISKNLSEVIFDISKKDFKLLVKQNWTLRKQRHKELEIQLQQENALTEAISKTDVDGW